MSKNNIDIDDNEIRIITSTSGNGTSTPPRWLYYAIVCAAVAIIATVYALLWGSDDTADSEQSADTDGDDDAAEGEQSADTDSDDDTAEGEQSTDTDCENDTAEGADSVAADKSVNDGSNEIPDEPTEE